MIAPAEAVAAQAISLPTHRSQKRLRSVAQLLVSNVDKKEGDSEVRVRLCNYTDVYKNQRITSRLAFMVATATTDEIDRFRLRLGDVIITKDSESWNDIAVPSLVEYEAPDLVCGYHLAILRPHKGMTGAFLLRALQTPEVAAQFHVRANGITRYGLSQDAIKSAIVPVPPPEEQDAIVRFLDYMDRRIRRYIAAKQRLIKLLQEQKQAIIQQAVTRGLDPNVRLKPSGVEWLGDIPEHWEATRLGRIIIDGPRNGISPPMHEAGNVESFSISAVRDGVVDVRDEFKKYVAGDSTTLACKYNLLAGDVLLVRGNGNIRLVGRAGVVQEDMPGRIYPDLLMRMRLASKCIPPFVVALLNSQVGRDQIEMAAHTAVGTFKINNQQVRQLWFGWPPAAEQRDIMNWLVNKLRGLINAVRRLNEEIGLLKEFRTRLIADVVTGKLDVRCLDLPDDGYDEDIADVEIDDAELDEMSDEAVEEEEAVAL